LGKKAVIDSDYPNKNDGTFYCELRGLLQFCRRSRESRPLTRFGGRGDRTEKRIAHTREGGASAAQTR